VDLDLSPCVARLSCALSVCLSVLYVFAIVYYIEIEVYTMGAEMGLSMSIVYCWCDRSAGCCNGLLAILAPYPLCALETPYDPPSSSPFVPCVHDMSSFLRVYSSPFVIHNFFYASPALDVLAQKTLRFHDGTLEHTSSQLIDLQLGFQGTFLFG
jgi:hypothetical protein